MSNSLHYRGNVIADFLASPPMGPDTGGAFYMPIEASYDPVTDRTTGKLRPVSREKAQELWLNKMVRAS